ncbi:YicC/YloC family endoribonuclease [Tropicimonas isoalkanivorans]|uniref:TIGR00255 family protein n=1 Tax=Tropicimonas isoalkanivorans TaxID=441112 RepID=A0A1I1DAM5_9RHOB|nr:YicC/YloC family endoribonuclease [Tropicimonas isoalkanivorans]SFB71412.1 TIGR00255 family protein [Tropicimonas isoalkanivorans]
MIHSMTGFASRTGQAQGYAWAWDLRSLNARGLDVRMRLPDWIEGLEPALRTRLAAAMKRGSVTMGLKVWRAAGEDSMEIDADALNAALRALGQVAGAAGAIGVTVAPPTAAEILTIKGVQLQGPAQAGATTALRDLLLDDVSPLLEDFLAARAREGEALARVLGEQLDRITALTADAASRLDGRATAAAEALKQALARVMENADAIEESRVAQELAMIAVKADVTEELDRLSAHVDSARALLDDDGPVGRKLEFLTQEFNREANTLCSKSQDVALTRIGLDLKAVIDQMREQVQNVE